MIPFTFVIVELAGGETEIELEFISLLMTFHLGYKLINFQTLSYSGCLLFFHLFVTHKNESCSKHTSI